jgi:hypothetical protein
MWPRFFSSGIMIAGSAMTKNARTVSLVAIGVVALVALVLIGRDVFLRRQQIVDCGDGPRHAIDIRDFTTQYSAYSIELEANIGDKGKVSTKLNPGQLQQVSDAERPRIPKVRGGWLQLVRHYQGAVWPIWCAVPGARQSSTRDK